MITEQIDKLAPVLEAIQNHPGIQSAVSDDWDSARINIFIELKVEQRNHKGKSLRFGANLFSIRNHIKAVMKRFHLEFSFLDWPQKKYSYQTYYGRREYTDEGYDTESFKIDVNYLIL
jgi:hypothetical protein